MLSTIITAYNNDDLIIAHLKGSMDVSRIPDEIIVVNDGGDDSLRDKIKAIDKKCPIIYVKIHEDITWNYNGACNLAVWLSKGDFLAFEDADNIPSYEFYQLALDKFETLPDVVRMQARGRNIVSLEDMLTKPKDEWTILKAMGPNMGTAIIRRHAYLTVKGQDERFCGRYGYMYYDWKSRMMRAFPSYSGQAGNYFYTMDGQTDLKRGMNPENRKIYRDNAREERTQSPYGMLNFTYDFELL